MYLYVHKIRAVVQVPQTILSAFIYYCLYWSNLRDKGLMDWTSR
nr:MAG TPA: hypothetical protein [Bacteriophage sp.]